MAYSYNVYTGNGSNTQFTIEFPYIRREHVKVYVAYVDTAYTYVTNTLVQLATAPGDQVRVEVRRVTPAASPLVDFTDGSTLVAADLDTSNLQHLYLEQELDDASKQGIYVDPSSGQLTAGGQQIKNVANPTAAQDAATKAYVDTADALRLKRDGTQAMTGALPMGGFKVTGAADPTSAQDLATKTYVDTTTVASAGDSMTGPLAMGGNKVTGLGTPTANADAATKSYVDAVALAALPDGDRGDITVSGVGTVWTIDNGAVVEAKIGTGAVTETKLGTGSVTSAKIADDTIVNADVNASAGIVATKLAFTQAGTGATARTIDSKLKDVVSVKDFGAVGNGTTDDTAAIQAAITASQNVLIPNGTYKVSSQLVSTGNLHLTIQGTLSPLANAGSPGTAMLSITGSNATIRFEDNGGIDCISNSFSNWCGIYAASPSDMIENIYVYGGRFRNIGINNTSATVIAFSGIKAGAIQDTNIKNCGVVGNVVGGAAGISTANSEGIVVKGNVLNTVGSTGINMSCGLNNAVRDNALNKITLFGFKGGYGLGSTVSNNVAATSTTFTVAKNATALITLKVGQAFYIPRASSFPSPQGVIKSIVDNTTYLTITTMVAMGATPSVGEQLQPLDTNCVWSGNSITYTGDNGFDQNGIYNITVTDNRLMYCGWYQDVGVFAGLRDGIWLGYDPQGSLNNMHNTGATIANNTVQHTYGSAIELYSTNNVSISNNTCFYYNEGQDPSSATPAYGGISVGRLGYYRNNSLTITGNTCRADSGYGIYAGYSENMLISSNNVQSAVGIKLNTGRLARVSGNLVRASIANAYGILVSDDSAANNSSGVVVIQNQVYISASTGDCIRISDAGATSLFISDDNVLEAANVAVNRVYDSSTSSSGMIPRGDGVGGAISTRPMRFTLAPGATFKLAEYLADPGTIGGARVFGFMRNGTSGFEFFEVFYYGNTAMPTVLFSSKGSPNGSAFLASGDFTTSTVIPSVLLGCNYTNNETNTVSASIWVQAFSRI